MEEDTSDLVFGVLSKGAFVTVQGMKGCLAKGPAAVTNPNKDPCTVTL